MYFLHIFMLTIIIIVIEESDCGIHMVFVDINYPYYGFMHRLLGNVWSWWKYKETISKKDTYDLPELRQIMNMMNITQPDEVLDNKNKVLDLNEMTDHPEGKCNCPRVYMPVCASNRITYSNACVMHCDRLNTTVIREGPCIAFRRKNSDIAYNITLPKHWVTRNATSDKLIQLTLLKIKCNETEDTLKNPTLRRMAFSQALLDFIDKAAVTDPDLRINVLRTEDK